MKNTVFNRRIKISYAPDSNSLNKANNEKAIKKIILRPKSTYEIIEDFLQYQSINLVMN